MSIFCATSSTSHDALLRQGFGGHPASRSGTVQILRSALARSRMVGEEEGSKFNDSNGLRESAGQKMRLISKGYFRRCPHPCPTSDDRRSRCSAETQNLFEG